MFVTLEVPLVLPRLTSRCSSGAKSVLPGFRILAGVAARILPTVCPRLCSLASAGDPLH